MSRERVLHRVVFPEDGDLDVLPLYLDLDQSSFGSGGEGNKPASADTPVRQHIAVQAASTDQIHGRRELVVPAGSRASLATYFNAFPASYWRRWTAVESVTLRMTISGDGRVMVYRSTPDGRINRVESASVADGTSRTVSFDLPLTTFNDGGWYWFDLIGGHSELRMADAEYTAQVPDDSRVGSVTVSITTFNRPDFCAQLLDQIASSGDVLDVIDEVLVVDQGNQKVADRPEYPDVEKALEGRLRVIDQANLGGSGGFARGMHETVSGGRSDYVLLLDDDVVSEPESILRAVTFADLCRRPTIVGGHMFSLYSRAALHSFGERVNRWRFWWGAAAHVEPDFDFAVDSLRSTPWLHRRIDVDYNGWWMCLIPTHIVREIGLSLPVFIKWDDSEYGLRAGQAGYPTVSMPGVAVWHVPWSDKDDALDWQAYYHQRNRFVAALLHSPYERGGRMVQESVYHQLKHILAMQYSTAELRLRALEDVLSGPDHLHRGLAGTLGEVRSTRAEFVDAQVDKDPEAFPAPYRPKPPKYGREAEKPSNRVSLALRAAVGLARQARPVPEMSRVRPQAQVPARDAKWWTLAGLDSAIVSTLDGTAASWYQRDRGTVADLVRRSSDLHARVLREWPELAAQYRAAAPSFVSPQEWERTFRGDRTDS